tara:strand:+ start:12681 stop:12857 length:177 start_codon:yes stop_codon:yes gene_type:complete
MNKKAKELNKILENLMASLNASLDDILEGNFTEPKGKTKKEIQEYVKKILKTLNNLED